MTNPQVALVMVGLFVLTIALGFPIWVTLMAMGVFFGYFAMGSGIFTLLTQNTFSILSNDVLTAVPLFLFMGYIVERANILDRLFSASRSRPGASPARWRWQRC
jgi:TRAP-type mannitol/chloroaromatic compound transport system permease large subunit